MKIRGRLMPRQSGAVPVCTRCRREHGESGRWCGACLEWSRQRRRARIAAEQCPACGRPKGGALRCLACADSEADRQRSKAARGLCRQCAEPAARGRSYCAMHLRRHAARRRAGR